MKSWDFLHLAKIMFLGCIQGITEVFPISSTGHLIIIEKCINLSSFKRGIFETSIQFGSALAIACFFRKDLYSITAGIFSSSLRELKIVKLLVIGFAPIVLVGSIFMKSIKIIYCPETIAVSLIFGGFIILKTEARIHNNSLNNLELNYSSLHRILPMQALIIGLSQCLAIIPGLSRLGITVVVGILLGLKREISTKFSLFLAIPTISAASMYSIGFNFAILTLSDLLDILVGSIISFLSTILIIPKIFKFLETYTYRIFGWYRLVLGMFILMYVFYSL